ncbi:four helix bundle protein [Oscillatoria sp. FACHB-1407]|uniref:four helix bundle protein n=1 Tax=Oscillatoria sp. FACHB-1407 TaxID=2692847 RepID=UPI0028154959|nr:four helix bundle protein [Oscillatoria sp. FACHB-1407]
MGGKIQSYRDLEVWQQGMTLAEACYHLTKTFPKEEVYGFVGQIRRAAVSIPANIAEGYGREYRNEYIQFLRIAQGSLKELETHLLLAVRVDLISIQIAQPILDHCESTGKLLRALLRALQKT